MIDESLPHRWFHRRGFKKSRMFLLFIWLFAGNVLTMGYKSTLLSTLIPIRYEKQIDTIQDMDESGLPFLIPGGTVLQWLGATDPRPAMQSIMKRHELFPFDGQIRPEDEARYLYILIYCQFSHNILFNTIYDHASLIKPKMQKSYCRTLSGEAAGFVATTEQKLKRNIFHFSKEIVVAVPSSFILPKESPLIVRGKILLFQDKIKKPFPHRICLRAP